MQKNATDAILLIINSITQAFQLQIGYDIEYMEDSVDYVEQKEDDNFAISDKNAKFAPDFSPQRLNQEVSRRNPPYGSVKL